MSRRLRQFLSTPEGEAYQQEIARIKNASWSISPSGFSARIKFKSPGSDTEEYYRDITQGKLEAMLKQVKILIGNGDVAISDGEVDTFCWTIEAMKGCLEKVRRCERGGISLRLVHKPLDFVTENCESLPDLPPALDRMPGNANLSIAPENVARIGELVMRSAQTESTSVRYQTDAELLAFARRLCERALSYGPIHDASKAAVFGQLENMAGAIDACTLAEKFLSAISKKDLTDSGSFLPPDLQVQKQYPGMEKSLVSLIKEHFTRNTVLVVEVERPSHTFHCLAPLASATGASNGCARLPRPSHVIFANQGGNFEQQLKALSCEREKERRTDRGRDRGESSTDEYRFILHPENLDERECTLLKEFIESRISDPSAKGYKVVIITSVPDAFLDRSKGYVASQLNGGYFPLKIPREAIQSCCDFTASVRFSSSVHVNVCGFYSSRPGQGKTQKIRELMRTHNEAREQIHHFLDATHEEIPWDFHCHLNHIELAPDLFGNSFSLIDQLFVLCNYGYYLRRDGKMIHLLNEEVINGTNAPKVFLFEIPADGRITDFDRCDFPIAICSDNLPITGGKYVSSYLEMLGLPSFFITTFDEGDWGLGERTKQLSQELFGVEIAGYRGLFQVCCKAFFNVENAHINDIRMVQACKNYVEKFVSFLTPQTESDKWIFLFILRSLFDVIPGLCTDRGCAPSVVIFPHALMDTSADKGDTCWTILCHTPRDDRRYSIPGAHSLRQTDLFALANDLSTGTGRVTVLTSQSPPTEFFMCVLQCFIRIDKINWHQALQNDRARHFVIAKALNDVSQNIDKFPNDKFSDLWDGLGSGPGEEQSEFGSLFTFLKLYKQRRGREREPPSNVWSLMCELLGELSSAKDVLDIASMALSLASTIKLVATISKLVCRIFQINEGNTGIGKTRSIMFICKLISLLKESQIADLPWRWEVIDFHGGVSQADVKERFEAMERSFVADMNVIVLLDEINTSPGGGYAINYALNAPPGMYLQHSQFAFVGAINGREEMNNITRQMIRCGIPQVIPKRISSVCLCKKAAREGSGNLYDEEDRSKLAYNVLELPKCAESLVTCVEPNVMSETATKWMTPEERDIIKNRVEFGLLLWLKEELKKRNGKEGEEQRKLHEMMGPISNIFVSVMSNVFAKTRELMGTRAIVSYRDVIRIVEIFITAFSKISKKKDGNEARDFHLLAAHAIVVAFYVGFCLRFPVNVTVEEQERELEHLKSRFPASVQGQVKKISSRKYVFPMRRTIYEMVVAQCKRGQRGDIWNELAGIIEQAHDISLSYAYFRCLKYVVLENGSAPDYKSIIRFPGIMFNLLLIDCAHRTFRRNKESAVMSLLLVGEPGTSKTLASFLYRLYHMKRKTKKGKRNPTFFMGTYLCSRASEAESLVDQYQQAVQFYLTRSEKYKAAALMAVLLDEIGLANLNSTNPLKVFHSIHDRGVRVDGSRSKQFVQVLTIATSNYALDQAITNRGQVHCSGTPDDDDIVRCFAACDVLTKDTYESFRKLPFLALRKDSADNLYKVLSGANLRQIQAKVNSWRNRITRLWDVVGGRPAIIPMRPLYQLTNLLGEVTHVTKDIVCQIATLLTPFLSETHLGNSMDKACQLLEAEGLLEAGAKFNMRPEDIFRKAVTTDLFGNKSVLVRTHDYFASRDFERLRSLCDDISSGNQRCRFSDEWMFPSTGLNADGVVDVDADFDKIVLALSSKNARERNWILVLGNAEIADYILDLLNTVHPGNAANWRPILVYHGYPIHLPEHPSNVRFIFLLNDEATRLYEQVNPVPLPLLDRLVHIYMPVPAVQEDYDSKTNVELMSDILNNQENEEVERVLMDAAERRDKNAKLNCLVDECVQKGAEYAVVVTRTSPMAKIVLPSDGPYRFIDVSDYVVDDPYEYAELRRKMEGKELMVPTPAKTAKKEANKGKNKSPTVQAPTRRNHDRVGRGKKPSTRAKENTRAPEPETTNVPKVPSVPNVSETQNDERPCVLVVKSNNFLVVRRNTYENEHRIWRIVDGIRREVGSIKMVIFVFFVCKSELPKGLRSTGFCPVYWIEDLTGNPNSYVPFTGLVDLFTSGDGESERVESLRLQVARHIIWESENDMMQQDPTNQERNWSDSGGTDKHYEAFLKMAASWLSMRTGEAAQESELEALRERVKRKQGDVNLKVDFFRIIVKCVRPASVFCLRVATYHPDLVRSILKVGKSEFLMEFHKFVKEHYFQIQPFEDEIRSYKCADHGQLWELVFPLYKCFLNSANNPKCVRSIHAFKNYIAGLGQLQFSDISWVSALDALVAGSAFKSDLLSELKEYLIWRGRDKDKSTVDLAVVGDSDFWKDDSQRREYLANFCQGRDDISGTLLRHDITLGLIQRQLTLNPREAIKGCANLPHPLVIARAFGMNIEGFDFYAYGRGGIYSSSTMIELALYMAFSHDIYCKNCEHDNCFIDRALGSLRSSDISVAAGLLGTLKPWVHDLLFVRRMTASEFVTSDWNPETEAIASLVGLESNFLASILENSREPKPTIDVEASFREMLVRRRGELTTLRLRFEKSEAAKRRFLNEKTDEPRINLLSCLRDWIFATDDPPQWIKLECAFSQWVFDSTENLLFRQIAAVLVAMATDGDARAELELLIDLLNPWPVTANNEVLETFWLYFQEKAVKEDQEHDDVISGIIREAAKYALDKLNFGQKLGPLRACRPFVVSGTKVYCENMPAPHVDRVLYSLVMFHENGSMTWEGRSTAISEIPMSSINAFFKYIRFAPITRHLPALAEYAKFLSEEFACQLNLAYLLLKASKTCASLLKPTSGRECWPFFHMYNQRCARMGEPLQSAFDFIDSHYSHERTAWDRLNAYLTDAVKVHNAMILKQSSSRAFRDWVSRGSLEGMNYANIVVSAFAKVSLIQDPATNRYRTEVMDPLQLFKAAVSEMLVGSGILSVVSTALIDIGCGTILGIPEDLFKESLTDKEYRGEAPSFIAEFRKLLFHDLISRANGGGGIITDLRPCSERTDVDTSVVLACLFLAFEETDDPRHTDDGFTKYCSILPEEIGWDTHHVSLMMRAAGVSWKRFSEAITRGELDQAVAVVNSIL